MAMADTGTVEMERKQTKNRFNIRKIIAIAVTVLAVINLGVLFLYPELPAKLAGKSDADYLQISEEDSKGSEKAALTLAEDKREFNGKGIFDPLEGVKALDTDGQDITDKIAVAYIPGETIQQKQIHYTVYDSENEKLEASCDLYLENYEGPSVSVKNVGNISWEQLQKLTEVLVGKGKLKGDDGFGNDASEGVTYFYEVNPDMQTVEVTFSLTNLFQDYRMRKS